MIKPIRTTTDLNNAKTQLAERLKTNHGGVHDDEIEVLCTLIEQYESGEIRLEAPSPVAAIKFRMREMGLTPRQLEPFIGSRARVSEILSGKRHLSIDMIRSLHEGLRIPYESLISQRSTNKKMENSTPAVDRLNALGFDVDQNDVPSFLNTFMKPNASLALHRKTRTQRAASKTDQTSLLLWQAAVLKRSESPRPASKFMKSSFGPENLRVIARLSTKPDGPLRALRHLKELGISTVILPSLPGTYLDGAAMIGRAGHPVVGLTLRHDRVDSFWYTLLHELSHIALHYDQLLNANAAFVDDMEIRSEDKCELEADELGRDSLIPESVLSQVRWDQETTHDEVVAVAIRARVHVAIAAGRWQRDHQNYKKFSRLIERGTVRELFETL